MLPSRHASSPSPLTSLCFLPYLDTDLISLLMRLLKDKIHHLANLTWIVPVTHGAWLAYPVGSHVFSVLIKPALTQAPVKESQKVRTNERDRSLGTVVVHDCRVLEDALAVPPHPSLQGPKALYDQPRLLHAERAKTRTCSLLHVGISPRPCKQLVRFSSLPRCYPQTDVPS